MTDAERVAKAWGDLLGIGAPAAPEQVERFQRLIDSGVITVPPPPDPAEQIADEFAATQGGYPVPSRPFIDGFRRLIADGWIVPGPRCEGYEPQPDPLVQAVLDAAEVLVEGRVYGAGPALIDAVRAWREAQP